MSTATATSRLDALEQVLYARKPVGPEWLILHNDRGVRCVSIRYTERLAYAGLELNRPGSSGDSLMRFTRHGRNQLPPANSAVRCN